jgi:hypothetical protein
MTSVWLSTLPLGRSTGTVAYPVDEPHPQHLVSVFWECDHDDVTVATTATSTPHPVAS